MEQKMNFKLMPRPVFWEDARLQKENKPGLFLELLIFALVFFIANIAQTVLLLPGIMVWLFSVPLDQLVSFETFSVNVDAVYELVENMPSWLMVAMLFSFAGISAISILYCLVIEKRKPATMGLSPRRAVPEYLLGLAIGLVMFSAVFGLSVAFGGYRFTGLVLDRSGVVLLILAFFGFAIQGAAEELLVRGYLATTLGTRAPVWLAVFESSLIFGLLHVSNVGMNFLAFLNVTLCGVFFSCYMIKRNNIWGACAIHAMWNFVQGSVFGLHVSGLNNLPTVFGSEMIGYNKLLTGGDFGPEASLCTTLVLLAALAAVLAIKPRAIAPPLTPEPAAQ